MNPDQQKAYSLVELLVTLSLLTLLTSLAVPAFKQMLTSNHSQSTLDSLKGALQAARSHSINQRITVEVCGSSDGQACDHNWGKGWLIRESNSETLIRTEHHPTEQGLSWRGLGNSIRFIPSGHSHASNGTFTYCGSDASPLWQLALNRQGRLRQVRSNEIQHGACTR